jgi:hypothetical protein
MFEVNYERARSLIAEQTQPSRNKYCWYFCLFNLKAPNDALENWHSYFVFTRSRFQISFPLLVMLISVSSLPPMSGDFSVLQSVPTCYGDHPQWKTRNFTQGKMETES